jgi:hypothetical protein
LTGLVKVETASPAAAPPTAAMRHHCGGTQSQRGHTAGQEQCLCQYVHNFHWFKVLFDSKAHISRHRMRNTLSPRQLACQVSKRPFYRQKTVFLAERTDIDAQRLHEVAQKVRGSKNGEF